MARMLDVVTNRPGGILSLSRFDWYEGEYLSLRIRVVEYRGGPPIDCTGWTTGVTAGLYLDPRKPGYGPIGIVASLSADGWLAIIAPSTPEQNAAGLANQYPDGRPAWIWVRITDGTYSAYLVKPSPLTLRQGPGATS